MLNSNTDRHHIYLAHLMRGLMHAIPYMVQKSFNMQVSDTN